MNRERFEQILEAYGADPNRWPPAERAEAEACRAAHTDAAEALMAQAGALDAALDADKAPPPQADLLAARILKGFPQAPLRVSQSYWRPAAALAACALFGVLIGLGGARLAPVQDDSADAVLNAAFGEGGEG